MAHLSTLRITCETSDTCHNYDVVVVGGGIVGTASARELITRYPHLKIALVEKEICLARHQSGNNSGVIHAGIYYEPGSLKAKLCVQGLHLTYKYLHEKNIKYRKCGKLIVATTPAQVSQLAVLQERARRNGVRDVQLVERDQLAHYQPRVRGLRALWSPHTGVVDWAQVTRAYAYDFQASGGTLYVNFKVNKFMNAEDADYPVIITDSEANTIKAKYVLTCCGLHSDVVARLTGGAEEPKIVPFRGEYLYLSPEKSAMVKTNVYPVPDPRLPFLGVHVTPLVDGRIIIGPNAVLAFSREGYRWGSINLMDLAEVVAYRGFRTLVYKYMGYGVREMARSLSVGLQVEQLQRLLGGVERADVRRGPAGVRAQALAADGKLVDDFVFEAGAGRMGAAGRRVLHCRNAPSPGATSSLAIAIMIADRMKREFSL